MAERIAEKGALQYAADNYAGASAVTNKLGAAGFIQGAYVQYLTWKAANAGVNPSRLGARGRIYGKFFDTGL